MRNTHESEQPTAMAPVVEHWLMQSRLSRGTMAAEAARAKERAEKAAARIMLEKSD